MKGPASGLRFERLPGLPHRAVIYGYTMAELFEHAAEAAFGLGLNLAEISPTYSRPIVAPGDSMEELLANWLDELSYVSQRAAIVWSWFVVDRLEEGGVQGSASGLPAHQVEERSEVVTGTRIVSDGIVEVPDGWWVELEFEVGPPGVRLA